MIKFIVIIIICNFLIGCSSNRNEKIFNDRYLDVELRPSELDKTIYRLAGFNFKNTKLIEKENGLRFTKFEVFNKYPLSKYELLFAQPKNYKSLFGWVTYEKGDAHTLVTLGVQQTECYETYGVLRLYMRPPKDEVYDLEDKDIDSFGNVFENSRRNLKATIFSSKYALDKNSYVEYQSEHILRPDGSEKLCVQRVKIYQ